MPTGDPVTHRSDTPGAQPAPAADGYQPDQVEAKWQARWAERRTNETDLDGAMRPFYNLMMFPYPSAEGLHVGNMFAFTGADAYGRFKRLRGWNVFEPIGFDAFGIHSENYAIKLGINPAELIPRNIENFRRQFISSPRTRTSRSTTARFTCRRSSNRGRGPITRGAPPSTAWGSAGPTRSSCSRRRPTSPVQVTVGWPAPRARTCTCAACRRKRRRRCGGAPNSSRQS